MPSKRKHTGDDGKTAVPGESRVAKFHPSLEVLGDLDEASAAIGLARSLTKNNRTLASSLKFKSSCTWLWQMWLIPMRKRKGPPT